MLNDSAEMWPAGGAALQENDLSQVSHLMSLAVTYLCKCSVTNIKVQLLAGVHTCRVTIWGMISAQLSWSLLSLIKVSLEQHINEWVKPLGHTGNSLTSESCNLILSQISLTAQVSLWTFASRLIHHRAVTEKRREIKSKEPVFVVKRLQSVAAAPLGILDWC